MRPYLHLGVVAIEKGAFESPSIKVAHFTFTYIRFRRKNVLSLLTLKSFEVCLFMAVTVHKHI